MKYVEFVGAHQVRIAIGENASFMVLEVTPDCPTTMSDGEKQTNGCVVSVYGLPGFYTKDFYLNVLEKIQKVGGFMSGNIKAIDRMTEVMAKE